MIPGVDERLSRVTSGFLLLCYELRAASCKFQVTIIFQDSDEVVQLKYSELCVMSLPGIAHHDVDFLSFFTVWRTFSVIFSTYFNQYKQQNKRRSK